METKIEDIYKYFEKKIEISTDTRKITAGSLFFALKGENYDANKFAAEALEKGAIAAVIDNSEYAQDARYLVVPDTLQTLQDLAHFHRQKFDIPVLAITGSNGKTTTKELLNAVLSQKFKVTATKGNLNNHIGVPLTLLQIKPDTEFAIIEMGANHLGEIKKLCEIAAPNHGLITNIGAAHLEGFRNLAGVLQAKTEMYAYLGKHQKHAFISLTKPDLISKAKEFRLINITTYGTQEIIQPVRNVGSELVHYKNKSCNVVTTNLAGAYNFENIESAYVVGQYFGVSDALIDEAISNYLPQNNRSQLIVTAHNEVIMDAYNANPDSMYAALKEMTASVSKNKVLILGDMFELGKESLNLHKNVLLKIDVAKFKHVLLCGKMMGKAADSLVGCLLFENKKLLIEWLVREQLEDCLVLVKASRGMALEEVLEYL